MQQAPPVQQSVREVALAVLTSAAAARINNRYFIVLLCSSFLKSRLTRGEPTQFQARTSRGGGTIGRCGRTRTWRNDRTTVSPPAGE